MASIGKWIYKLLTNQRKPSEKGMYEAAAANEDEAATMALIDQDLGRRGYFAALGGREPSPMYSRGGGGKGRKKK